MNAQNKTTKVTANFGAKGWLLMLFSFACIFIDSSLINDSLNVTREVFAGTTGMNYGVLSMFSTVGGWIAVAGGVLWGYIGAKKSARFAWTCSLAITAIACFAWGYAANYVVYFVCVSVAMVGGMGFAYIANGNVIGNWFPKKKGLVMGWVTIGFPLSAVIATPLCSALLKGLGLSGIYYLYAALCVVLAVIVFLYVRDYPEEKGAYPDNDASFDKAKAEAELKAGLEYMKTSPWTGKKLLRTGTVWKMVISLGVMELLSLGIMTNFLPRMQQIGYAEGQIIPMLAVAGLLACVGSVLCGLLDSKVGPKKAIIITYIVAIISIVLNVVAGNIKTAGNEALATPLFFISLPFLAIMLGGAANYLVSLTNTIWGRYDFPAAYRLLKPLVAVVGALGMTVVGGLGNAGPGYGAAYMVLGVLALIGTIIMFTVDDSLVGRDR